MIPEEAIEDATQSIFEDDPRITESDAYDLASNALEAALPHLREQIADEALRDAADAWTQGAWADTPRHRDIAHDRIAAANYFGQWLRKRANQTERKDQ